MADKKVGLNELGRSGLRHFSGTLHEEFLPELKGIKGINTYKEMSENSAVLGAALVAVESLLRSVDWGVEPASEDESDLEAAEFLEEVLEDMSHTWEDFISEVLSMVVFGWSYFEIVYKKRKGRNKDPQSKYDDGRIGWRKFALRAQDTLFRWEIDDFGGIKGMWQYPTPGTPGARPAETVLIPIEKALLFRTTSTKNNPEGRSMLRRAYRAWYYAKRIEEIEAIGMDRDLNGIPIAKIPMELLAETKTPEQQSTFNYIRDVVTRTKRDEQHGILWPNVKDDEGNDMYEFELMTSGSSNRTFDTNQSIQRYQQQQAMVLMADFILLGHEAVGSFALSSDKTELFAVALGSILDSIEEVLNRHAVPRLFEVNSFDVEDLPNIRHGDIETPDLAAVATYIQSLAGAGAQFFPDMILENRLREFADLPPIDPEKFEQGLVPGAEDGFFGAQQQPVPPNMASPDQLPPPGDAPQQPPVQMPQLQVAKFKRRPGIRGYVESRR